jgi:hypothetical protein
MMKFDQKRKVWLFADAMQVSHGDIKVDMAHQLMTDDKTNSRKALAVEMAITHSDFINLNNRLYLGSSMKDDISSWTKPYQKPVIRKHDMNEDPIGRVYSAKYIQQPGVGVSVNATLANKDEVLKFLEVYKPGNKPTGHIQAGFYVADPDAINKWLDGRYQTVSIGFQTQEAFCSKCGANFSTMTPDEAIEHEHEVGQDGCHLVVGHILYEHLAVVNLPADEFTHVQSIKWAEQTFGDSVRPRAFFINGNKTLSLGDEAATPMSQINLPKEEKILWPVRAKLLLENADAKHENYVTKEGDHQHRVILDPATENGHTDYVLRHSHDVLSKVVQASDAVYDYDQKLESGEYVIKLAAHSHELGEKVEPLTDSSEVKYINEFVCEDEEETFSEDDNLAGLLFMDTEYEKGIDELIVAGTVPADAKLSTEKRKGLPSTAFCGPSRSFPVNDCAHYTAALRLLNRAKFSDATKAKVHACIVRKGKALGCTSEKDEQTTVAPVAAPVPLTLDELLVREDVKAHIKTIEGPMQATIAKLEAQVVVLTQQVKDLEAAKTGDAQTAATQQDQITALVDQNVRLFKRIRSGLVDNIILKTQLTNDGPLADSMKPAAGESTEDCIARVRNILNTESTEALQSKLDAVTKVGQPILQKLAPSTGWKS